MAMFCCKERELILRKEDVDMSKGISWASLGSQVRSDLFITGF